MAGGGESGFLVGLAATAEHHVAQVAERLEQGRALGHPGGQDHQLAPGADEPAVQAELADHLPRQPLVGGGAGDKHLPVAVGGTTADQRRAHGRRGG